MHPALIEALATEHRTALLRQAEAYRRARRSERGRTGLTLAAVVSRTERVVASLRRHTAAVPPRTQTCCA